MPVRYDDIVDAVAPTGMLARGGFVVDDGDESIDGPDGPVASVVVIGNIGGAMWPRFRAEETAGSDPLDRWARELLGPIAASLGAHFVHPSDRPYRPFQRWAQAADDVWPSPIGLMIHPEAGLWHAYRGAFLFGDVVEGLPPTGRLNSPCLTCTDQPCLSTCPVEAFTAHGYDSAACAGHVRSGSEPDCLHAGCAARRACPVGQSSRYGADQMLFHMRAFVGERP